MKIYVCKKVNILCTLVFTSIVYIASLGIINSQGLTSCCSRREVKLGCVHVWN